MKTLFAIAAGALCALLVQFLVIDPLKAGTFDAVTAAAVFLGLALCAGVARQTLREQDHHRYDRHVPR